MRPSIPIRSRPTLLVGGADRQRESAADLTEARYGAHRFGSDAAQEDHPPASYPSFAKRALVLCLLLVVVTFAVFQRVPTFDFVDWDDGTNVFENPYYLPVSSQHLLTLWKQPYNALYMPITSTLWGACAALAWQSAPLMRQSGGVAHLAPDIFHSANLLIHLANVVLVFFLLCRLLGESKATAAAGGALLFGIHPLQVEPVAWITGTNNTLAAFFGLLCLLAYMRAAEADRATRPGGRFMVMATIAYVLALLSKPTAVALVLVVSVLEAGLYRRPMRTFLPWIGGWATLAVALAILTWQATPKGAPIYLPLWGRPFVVGDSIAFYLGKLIFPWNMGIDYGRLPERVLGNCWGYSTWLAPLWLGILLWRLRLRWPGVAFALFIAAALPMLGVVPFYFHWVSTVGDRYVYLSMVGPALAVAWLLSLPRLAARPVITIAIYCSVIALLGCTSYRQVETWHTSGSLFRQALAVNPRSARTYSNLGTVLSEQGNLAEAVTAYQRSLALNPRQSFAEFNLGAILLRQGSLNEAQPHLEAAARLNPADPDSYTDLGILYRSRGQPAEAIAEFQTSLRLADSPYVHNHLGLVYERAGRLPEATAEYETALRMLPRFASARQNLERIRAASDAPR